MESLYFLIPIAVVFVIGAMRLLFWAINSGQYDNLDAEAHRILFDEDDNPPPTRRAEKEAKAKAKAEKEKLKTAEGGGNE